LQTVHRIIFADSRKLNTLADQSIDLVITSPPYPMIEMWDGQFAALNPEIGLFLERGDYRSAFGAMHAALDPVWQELYRVMKEGALACINIGDAARTINRRFQLFVNHSRIQQKFVEIGFDTLPLILWRKQTNAPNKFMGSGMLPAGAYVTLEHEYILLFRKGNKRVFATADEKHNRMLSSYFWEERNLWFSDLWDFKGARQETANSELRARSAAFPPALPFRLINMFSVFGDTVLDPFAGTGTTTLAAIAAGRNSVGCEIDSSFSGSIRESILSDTKRLSKYNRARIADHLSFVQSRQAARGPLKYNNSYFGFPVMTRQEKELKLAFIESAGETAKDCYRVSYFDSYSRECLQE
jgi:modification methylase